jgi:hypothetical protein
MKELNEFFTEYAELLEIKKAGRKSNSKYLQRFGVPGHYVYIYPLAKMKRLSRKARYSYKRALRRTRSFSKKIGIAYGATTLNQRPKSWHTAIVKFNAENGVTGQLAVNYKKHAIYNYKSRRSGAGGSAKLARARKKGILRYR